ncbi:MFS transporter [Candidatus Nomurabacteria bacterium]|nr:MFS transporter [Candidatus Nomurabacteria bacterium]
MNHSPAEKHRLRLLAYGAGFFLSFSTAIGAYINSSFISQFVGEQRVGLLYSFAAAISLLASWQGLRLFRRFGNRRSIIFLGVTNFLVLGNLALGNGHYSGIWLVVAYIVLSFLTAINLDIYLEELSDNQITGRIRGVFLTVNNLAWLISPFLASRLTSGSDFSLVYTIAATALLPFIYISVRQLKEVVKRGGENLSLASGLGRVFASNNPDLRRIMTIDLLLNFFSAMMVIYMPIYLHQHIGLAWTQIGVIFTIMLIPFVLLDFPLGRIADLWWGERELLLAGLTIIIIACLIITQISSASVVIWASVLFFSRIGAATVEAMKETYLFKIIDGRDANLVFISRSMYPIAYIFAPIIASIFLSFLPLSYLFTFLGLFLIIGLPVASGLRDTR